MTKAKAADKAAQMGVVTVASLPQNLADMATEGKTVKDRIAVDTKRLKAIDQVFKDLHIATGNRSFFAPSGELAVQVEPGERHILDQPKLNAEFPEVVKACDKLSQWETPKYHKTAAAK